LGRVQTALARPRPCYCTAFERTERVTLGEAERIAEQTREASKLFAQLQAWPFPKRRAVVAGTSDKAHAHLVERYGRDLSAEVVAVLLSRVVDKGWLRIAGSGNGDSETVYAPTASYRQALGHQFRRFLRTYALDHTDAFPVLRTELQAAAEDTRP
jgi:hypothetical protein